MTTPAPVVGRQGQTWWVPGVRIVLLKELRPGPQPGTILTQVEQDILHVQVTLVNHGSGQYCIRLNNWHDSLPADRKDPTLSSGEITHGGQPLWPRWKYNDFGIFQFGRRLRIDMRYFPEPGDPKGTGPETLAHRWVPMIAGPISDIRFTFSDKDGAYVEVCGEDDLCPLKNKNPKKQDYWARPEREICDDVIKRANYPLPVSPSGTPWPKFADDAAKAMAEAHFEGTSFLDYLKKFGDRMDYEVFMEFASLDNADSGVEFHFERSRCRLPPDRTLRDIHILERGKNLLDFTPTLHVVDQVTSMEVCGRNRVQTSPDTVCGKAPPTDTSPDPLDDELHRDEARKDPPLLSGPRWRMKLYGANPDSMMNQRGLDKERAELMADSYYRHKARQFLKIKAVTLGLPRLRAGKHVEIRGMRPPFDGFYYVEEAVHTYGSDGLRTAITARRPGAPFPPYGE